MFNRNRNTKNINKFCNINKGIQEKNGEHVKSLSTEKGSLGLFSFFFLPSFQELSGDSNKKKFFHIYKH